MRRALLVWTALFLLGFDWAGRIDEIAAGLRSADAGRRREVVNALGTFPTASTRTYLLAALEDPDVSVRVAAAGHLARGAERAAVPRLIGWLSDPEAPLREAGCSALAQMADPRATAALIRTLGDAEADVRRAAVVALGALATPDVIVPLLGRLDDSHPRVRESTAEVLGRLRDERAVVPLIGKVQDLESQVRIRVVHALSLAADARAVPALLQALRDTTVEVRLAAVAALGHLRAPEAVEPIVTLLEDSEPRLRQGAVQALGQIGGAGAIAALARALGRGDLRRDCVEALVRIGPAAVPALQGRLTDPHSVEAAVAAAEALGEVGDLSAGPSLVEALQAGRIPAARVLSALGKIGDSGALVPILERLSDRRSDVRAAAAEALEPLLERTPQPDGRAADPLIVLVGDRSESLRIRAVRLLGVLAAPRAAERLLRVLEEDTGPIRIETVRALGRIRSRRATTRLLALLDDTDGQLRAEVAVAIGRIADPASVPVLLEKVGQRRPSDRVAALSALGFVLRAHPDDHALEVLASLAAGTDESIAARAIDAIARSRSPRGVTLLAPLLDRPDEWVRAKVADALGALPGERASTLLVEALTRDEAPSVRVAAAFALSHHGSPAATRALVGALRDDGWGVAPNAATALGSLGAREVGRAVCAQVDAPDIALRAAAVRAAASLGAPCATPQLLLSSLRAPTALLREVGARLLSGAEEAAASDALRTCADQELDPAVGRACAQALRPRVAAAPEEDWTEFFLYDGAGQTLRPHARFLLVLPDGRIKAGYTDLNGFAREEPVPAGQVRVEDPDDLGT